MRCGDSRRSSAIMAGRRSAQECGRRALAKRRLNVMTFRASTGWTLPRRSRRRPGRLRHHRPAGRQRPPPPSSFRMRVCRDPDRHPVTPNARAVLEQCHADGCPHGHSRDGPGRCPATCHRTAHGHHAQPDSPGPESGASMPAGAAGLRLVAVTASELKYAATLRFSQRSRRPLQYVAAQEPVVDSTVVGDC